ncbi:hypothetical protein L2E82_39196 [Cichorium intybus]|uniref:Uncharacterized protein n=1 Tax=Cichorium intybus TaxID=13427 RepID=A0ACB9AIJ2_CICIN|nr:hypothetical protein L2E82_39196 [Cichorium intybus]
MFRLKQTLGFEPSEDELAASLRISKAELQVKQSECKLAREKLAMSNVSLVMSVAQKYANMGAEICDVIQGIQDFYLHTYVVKEAASANDAERSAEVIIIIYWKLSLMVHPDKCPYLEANQAFIKLNKPFKDLQDPVKRKAMDDKIDEKEENERFKLKLKAMREVAQGL